MRTICGLLTLFVLWHQTAAEAQVVTVTVQSRVCVRGTCHQMTGYGSGVVVATEGRGHSIVLTAAHNFNLTDTQGRPTTSGTIDSVMVGGARAELVQRWYDDRSDLAIVRVAGQFPSVAPLAQMPPAPGDRVAVSGYDYAQSGRPVLHGVQCQVVTANPGERGTTSRSWPVGMSGGAVLNADGNLVGIAVTSSGFQINRNFRELIHYYAPQAVMPEPRSAATEQPASVSPDRPGTVPLIEDVAASKGTVEQLADASTAGVQGRTAEPEGSGAGGKDTASAKERLEHGKQAVGTAVDTADSLLSNPLVQAAILAGTGGSGAAALSAWQMLMAVRRRKKEQATSQPQTAGTSVPSSPVQEVPAVAAGVSAESDKVIAELKEQLRVARASASRPPRLIEVPVDRWNDAYAWAKAEMARDGSRPATQHFVRLESLIQQFMAANPDKGA